MRPRLLSAVLLLVALSTPGALAACPHTDDAVIAWLDKMAQSIRQTSYQGVVTLQRGADMQVMQVSHVTDGSASVEQLVQLNGQGARVVREGRSRDCEAPASPEDCEEPGLKLLAVSRQMEQGNCGITERYSFRLDGQERVAGRKAVKLRVRPLDIYRFGYTLALDEETGLLLKTEMVGHDGRVLEKFQFANLSYDAGQPEAPEVSVVHHVHQGGPAGIDSSLPVSSAWQVRWVPEGFTATDDAVQVAGRRTYTDGLAVFSVFLEDFDGDIRPGEGYVREGATTSYTRGGQLGDMAVLVTVIGEVPLNTARMVADSVSWAP